LNSRTARLVRIASRTSMVIYPFQGRVYSLKCEWSSPLTAPYHQVYRDGRPVPYGTLRSVSTKLDCRDAAAQRLALGRYGSPGEDAAAQRLYNHWAADAPPSRCPSLRSGCFATLKALRRRDVSTIQASWPIVAQASLPGSLGGRPKRPRQECLLCEGTLHMRTAHTVPTPPGIPSQYLRSV
jgi:hypothetical protein